jgi:acetylornithine deacetylase/succinyl-diaminopimelate desuccinylase-like protein
MVRAHRLRLPEDRSSARLTAAALALCLLATAGVARAIWPFSTSDGGEDLGPRAAQLLAEMIRYPTINPPGDEGMLADQLTARLRAAGLEARSIETPPAPGGGRRAATWARLRGSGEERPLILLSHLDVVPAEPSEWTRDPFSGEIADGYVYGRGAIDAKGVTTIQVMAMERLAGRETPLRRDVILLATPDEETGGLAGAGYLARERPELFENAEYLLTEGGSIRPRQPHLDDRVTTPSMWGVTITEKSPCWLAVETRGTPGHGSAPRRDAAVPRLLAALDRVRRAETPVHVLAEVEDMFLALAANASAEDRAGFVSLATSLDNDPAFRRRFLANPSYNALVRNTISITVLQGGSRTNVVPGTARAEIDARLLPGERCEDFTQGIRAVVADPEVEITPILSFPSRSSPADTELFAAIERVAKRSDPNAIVVPRMIGGFTDAHWFRERGIVAYGFVPRWLSGDDARGVHGADERISIDNLERGTLTLVDIIEELAAP